MATRIIVSYDDSDNDRDALALGRLLAFPGAELSLAYVRHSQQLEPQREELEQKQAEELLENGAAAIGAPEMARHVVLHASTAEGLAELAESEGADIVVFGSDYRTAAGLLKPGIAAHRLLLGGPAAIAVAPADLRSHPSIRVSTIGLIDEGDPTARQTAESLAGALGATVQDFKARRGVPIWFGAALPSRGTGCVGRGPRPRGRGRRAAAAPRANRSGGRRVRRSSR